MKTKAEDCAYPAGQSIHTEAGLTKREYFAALALQGMTGLTRLVKESPECLTDEEIAEYCVRQADALIKVLNKEHS